MTRNTLGTGINRQRLFAAMDGSFAVFLIGMRINSPWKVQQCGQSARDAAAAAGADGQA